MNAEFGRRKYGGGMQNDLEPSNYLPFPLGEPFQLSPSPFGRGPG